MLLPSGLALQRWPEWRAGGGAGPAHAAHAASSLVSSQARCAGTGAESFLILVSRPLFPSAACPSPAQASSHAVTIPRCVTAVDLI